LLNTTRGDLCPLLLSLAGRGEGEGDFRIIFFAAFRFILADPLRHSKNGSSPYRVGEKSPILNTQALKVDAFRRAPFPQGVLFTYPPLKVWEILSGLIFPNRENWLFKEKSITFPGFQVSQG
jgi:hypothetical protein